MQYASSPVTPFRHSAVCKISPADKVKNIPATPSVPKNFCHSPGAARDPYGFPAVIDTAITLPQKGAGIF